MSEHEEERDDTPPSVAEFLRRIERGRTELAQVVGALSDAQLSAVDPKEGWSVKDHLAHLAVWQNGMTALLRHEPRWQGMGVTQEQLISDDTDALNNILYQQHKDSSPADVRQFFAEAHRNFAATVASLSEEDLLRPYSHYQPDEPGEDNGQPIWPWMVGNSFEHYREHIPWIQGILARTR